MSRHRLLYYNDSRHTYMYSYDPPMSLQEAWSPVDEVAGTAVDTFVYGSGAGPAVMHDSKVGEVWGRRFDRFDSAWSWRAYENVKSLIDRGLDPLNVLIDRAHDKGMDFFASLRLNHPMDPADVDNPFNWQFRIDHPELCLTGSGKHAFNWIHPEVRAERFAYIEEYVTRYDIEGIELEFSFCPYYFEDGEAEKNAHILTEYMGEVRRAVDSAAKGRGRPIEFGVRILPTRDGNFSIGLDVAAWIQDGLLDFVVPTIYNDRQLDPNFPFEWLVDLSEGTKCEVYPTLQRSIKGLDIADDRMSPSALDVHAGLDHFRAGAASYWDRGADGIYMLFLKWPHGPEQREVLTEVHDPDLLRTKPKHYVFRRNDVQSAKLDFPSSLKSFVRAGGEGHSVSMYVADEVDKIDATLKLRLVWSTGLDDITVSINGVPLPMAQSTRVDLDAYNGAWLEIPVPTGVLARGWNEIKLVLNNRPPNLGIPIVWESAELVVTHAAALASSAMP